MALPETTRTAVMSNVGATWSEAHVFTAEESQLCMPMQAKKLSDSECRAFSQLFESREYAFRAGIKLSGVDYAVHQYETTRGVDLVYGRAGDAVSGSGACVARVNKQSSDAVYMAVSYKFPSLSANAVSKLVSFAGKYFAADKSINS